MVAFEMLENRRTPVNIIHCSLDNKIPFCEYFIIPYIMWFFLLAATVAFFVFRCEDTKEYWQFMITSGTGLTTFLIFSFVFPNGINIRPALAANGNIFIQAVKVLYRIDTPTNVLPSMHIFMTLACAVALCRNESFARNRVRVVLTDIIAVLICMSTVMLKQHSVVDVVLGLTLYAVCYEAYYKMTPAKERRIARFAKGNPNVATASGHER
jgi:membrane-associated phospholipid phosphatase